MFEIGKEYPPPGEDAAIGKLRELHLKVHHATPGPNLRGEHPKQHGGVWAIFEVDKNIPKELRTGIFKEPRSYTALVRYLAVVPSMTGSPMCTAWQSKC